MKYVITERQYKFLSEQPESRYAPEQFMSTQERRDFQSGSSEKAGKALMRGQEKLSNYVQSIDPNTVLMVAQMASAFIPVVGPFISAGIGIYDAAIYYQKGDPKTAGMVLMFSLLPGVGSLVGKIPFVKQLGAKGMAALAVKVAKGGANLTKAETQVVNGISKNLPLIKQELNSQIKTLSTQAAAKPVSSKVKNYLLKVGKNGLAFTGKNVAPYVGAGAGYEYAWNKYNPNPTFNFDNIDTKDISQENQKAAKELKF